MSRRILIGFAFSTVTSTACIDTQIADLPDTDNKPNVAANSICGEKTVASARASSGNLVMFCVDDGVEIVAEGGYAKSMSIDVSRCAVETFLDLTDATTPVPAALVESCALRGQAVAIDREFVAGPVFAAAPEQDFTYYGATQLNGAYCGTDGPNAFEDQQCTYTCPSSGPDLCGTWCKPAGTATHTSSISTVLGEQGNYAYETLASCNGTTTFRGLRDRGAADDGYVTLYDIDVLAGQTWKVSMSYTTGGEDAWFKFEGQAVGPAIHRYAGKFLDDK
jgi:hypothetical protein